MAETRSLHSDFIDSGGARCRAVVTISLSVQQLDRPIEHERVDALMTDVVASTPSPQVPAPVEERRAVDIQLPAGSVALDDVPPVTVPRMPAADDFSDTVALDTIVSTSAQDETALLKARLALEQERNRHAEAMAAAPAKSSVLVAAPSRQWFAYSTWVLIFTAVLDIGYVVTPMLTDANLMGPSTLAYINIAMAAIAQLAKMLKQTIPVTQEEKVEIVASAAALPMKGGERNIQVHIGGEVTASTPKG